MSEDTIVYRLIAEVDGEVIATSQKYVSIEDIKVIADLVKDEAEAKVQEAADQADFMEHLERRYVDPAEEAPELGEEAGL